MLNHVSIGVRDIERSKRFYDAILQPLGYRALSEDSQQLGYGDTSVLLWVGQSARPVTDDAASGLHFCFDAPSRQAVQAFHAAALRHGGRDNGPAGARADYGPNYYAAFVLDPDGYRLEAYYGGP